MIRNILFIAVSFALIVPLAGCETKAQTGALAGGAGGAALGAVIGHQSGHAGGGALIGGAVGALGGAVVGGDMDRKDERRQRQQEQAYRQNDSARPQDAAENVTRNDVIAWSAEGKSDDVIIDRIERSRSVFALNSSDESQLRKAGVSDRVLRAMKETARQ